MTMPVHTWIESAIARISPLTGLKNAESDRCKPPLGVLDLHAAEVKLDQPSGVHTVLVFTLSGANRLTRKSLTLPARPTPCAPDVRQSDHPYSGLRRSPAVNGCKLWFGGWHVC